MDAKSPKKKNADRFSDADVLNIDGRPIVANLEWPRSPAVLEFLRTNCYGTFDDIWAKVGGDKSSLRRLIRILKSRSNRYICVSDQSKADHNTIRKIVYELAPRGMEFLRTRGRTIPDQPIVSNFAHAALAAHGTASIEIGVAAQENATLITWDQIIRSKSMPPSTANAATPFDIPYPHTNPKTGEIIFRHARADSPVFGIKLVLPTRQRYFFFPGIEADNATKSEKQLIDQFTAYLTIERDHIYETYFGFPPNSWYVPFLVKNAHQADRVKWMMDILDRLTNGQGSKSIIFMRYDPDGKPGYLFTDPWRRVGHEPVILSQ